MGSGCDILLGEPERFVDYILADKKLRTRLLDENMIIEASEQVMSKDPSLSNVLQDIKSKGDDLRSCLANVINDPNVQRLLEANKKKKEKVLRKRVRQNPKYRTRTQVNKEVQRRLKISIARTKLLKKGKIDISTAKKQINVTPYKRGQQKISKFSKTKSRALTKVEERLIRNNIKKKPKDIVSLYLSSGLPYRTPTSIRKHYYRIKNKMN